jgi:hypothetical protein
MYSRHAQLQGAGAAQPDGFVLRQTPADIGGPDEQAHRWDQGEHQQMSEVVPWMGFLFLADIRPREIRLSEQLDDRCGHDDLQISESPASGAYEVLSAGMCQRVHFFADRQRGASEDRLAPGHAIALAGDVAGFIRRQQHIDRRHLHRLPGATERRVAAEVLHLLPRAWSRRSRASRSAPVPRSSPGCSFGPAFAPGRR